jgi:serine/threonine protein kinase
MHPPSNVGREIVESFTGAGQDVGEIPDDPRLLPIIQEYLQRLERGERPDPHEYLLQYPELAEPLAICLDGLEFVHRSVESGRAPERDSGANPADSPLPEALGDFRIVRELGRGGMGVVYEATQRSLGRRVALKVLPFTATLQPRQLQRFLNEAQAAAHLHHANIVPVFAVGSDRGVHYYAMQFIDGMSLAELLIELRRNSGLPEDGGSQNRLAHDSSNGKVAAETSRAADHRPGDSSGWKPNGGDAGDMADTANMFSARFSTLKSCEASDFFRTVAAWIRQAALGLAYAHDLGIVHRDIKPANLMLDGRGNVWVTDFGLARFRSGTDLTYTGDLIGTLRYMSPEQTHGDHNLMDHRTDVYSLGATLYELATLRPIYSGPNREALLINVARGEPRPPRAINRLMPIELETIILKAISKAPQDRYATAQAFADDLQRFLDDQPIQARRPSAVDRVRKWSRRYPAWVAAGILSLIGICCGLFIHNRMMVAEKAKTALALEREMQRANEAEDRFQQARQAVDVLIQVSEEDLADNPMFFATRKRLLETAAAYYQNFIEQREGNSASQQELAAVQVRVRGILRELATLQVHLQVLIVANPVVQADLKLSPQAQSQLTAFVEQAKLAGFKLFGEFSEMRRDTRRLRVLELADQHESSLAAILDGEQRERLRQIVLQVQGLAAFQEPEVIKALELSREQRRSIREIEFEASMHFGSDRKLPPGPLRPFDQNDPRVQQAMSRVLQLLAPDQVMRWHQLTGEKFAGSVVLMPPGAFRGPAGPGQSLQQ